MASKIGWLMGPDGNPGETWNPLLGCERVSPGCDGCYAVPQSNMRASNPNPKIQKAFDGLVHRVDGELTWTGKVNLLPARLQDPFRWKRPRYVFVNSLADLFHQGVDADYIAKVFAVMALNARHVFIVLTKRPGRMRSLLNRDSFWAKVAYYSIETWERYPPDENIPLDVRALPNVILGVSAEDQRWADVRVPLLLDTPAAYRAVSAEPLLGPVDLSRFLTGGLARADTASEPTSAGVDWVIVGGESGARARAMHPDWARSLRDQATGAGASFFFKQWGEWGPAPFIVRVCDPGIGWTGTDEELRAAKRDSEARGATHVHTGNPYELDGEIRYHLHEIGHKPWSAERVGLDPPHEPMRRWGVKKAGSELDGRAWTRMPVAPRGA